MPDFDEYLKALSKQKSTSSQSDCASSPKMSESTTTKMKRQSSSEPEEGQINEDRDIEQIEDTEQSNGSNIDIEPMGFKFGDQIEGLKIYRTIEEIESSLKEHKEEME